MTQRGGLFDSTEPRARAKRALRGPTYSTGARAPRPAPCPARRRGLVVAVADVGQQAREQRTVDRVLVGPLPVDPDVQAAHHLADLGVDVLPLPQADEVQQLVAALAAELRRRQLALAVLHVVPQGEVAEEVRAGHPEPGVQLAGPLLLAGGPLAGVLDGEPGDDDHRLVHAPVALGFEHHAPERGVERQAGQLAADVGEAAVVRRAIGLEGAELLEQGHAVGDVAAVGRLDEGERLDVAEADGRHLQDDRGQVGAQDLGLGELGAGVVVVLGVEADADAGCHAAAATGALVGAGLRDRLDRQALDLGPLAVAGDAGRARVDDVADARHRDGGLGDVGGDDHPPLRVAWNTRCCSADDSRANRGSTSVPGSFRPSTASAMSRISRSPDANTSTSPGPSRISSLTASVTAWTVCCGRAADEPSSSGR